MAVPAEQSGFEAPQGGRVIGAEDWPRQRFGWLNAVRRDGALSPTVKLVAHVLALDFANHETLQCDPSFRQLAEALGVSQDTVKRAVVALAEGGWIGRRVGRGRGKSSGYLFLSRAEIVPLKGGRYAPPKGGSDAPFSGAVDKSEKGANLRVKGGKSAPAYYKAKPYKNHRAREAEPGTVSETVAKWAAQIRDGNGSRARYLTDLDIRKLLAFELVTKDQLRRCGVDVD